MSHIEQRQFCEEVKAKFPHMFTGGKRVLDVGALDINGCNKPLFDFTCHYTGLDIGPGPNVDVVSCGHEHKAPDGYYDVVVSTECFEHDMHFPDTLKNIVRMLKPGGLFFFTCGGDGRGEHGTYRTDKFSSPHTTAIPEWKNYYRNVNEQWFREIVEPEAVFEPGFEFSFMPVVCDFRFYGFKK